MALTTPGTPQSGIQIYTRQPWNLVKTAFLVLTWIALGSHLELVGPTLGILAHNTDVAFSGFALALVSRNGGYVAGNLFGGISRTIVKNHSEVLLGVAFFLPALAMFATPFVTSLTIMCILFFLQGVAQGFTDLGGNNLLFTMWGAHATAPLNTVHLGYGFGAIFVNLLVRPFLGSENPRLNETTYSQLNSTLSSAISVRSNSDIRIPYMITAGLCLLVGAGHIVFYVLEHKNRRDKVEIRQVDYETVNLSPTSIRAHADEVEYSQYSPTTCGRGFFRYGLTLSSIFIAYMFFIGANDLTFSKFFFEYLKLKRFGISTTGASWGMILYWLSYSIGRLIGAIMSIFIPVYISLTIVWFGGLCLAIAWIVHIWVVGLTATTLFVLGSLTGLVLSPIFSLSCGLINQRLNVVPALLALLLCGAAFGGMTFQKIAGFVMDHDPNHFPTLLIVSIIMAILLYMVSNIIDYFHRRNLKNGRRSITNGAALTPEDFGEEQ